MDFSHLSAQDVLDFWFDELTPQQHFAKDAALDARIANRFGPLLSAAERCELAAWRASARGRLAEVIVLDQFSRNIFRDNARAFANDGVALALAQELVAGAHDAELPVEQRAFAYLPFMHSESLAIHVQAMALFDQPGLENSLRVERAHQDILQRFGRYPHRNAVLGRVSTPQELEFLSQPGSSF
ncbi:MAG: DUF924 family protein [Giesbergeria sp.]